MKKILLFAGTTEGRLLTEYLIQYPLQLHVCVATDYGKDLLPVHPNLTISSHRMNAKEMAALITQEEFQLVIDATHPYADIVTTQIKQACDITDCVYWRIIRDSLNTKEAYLSASSVSEAIHQLQNTNGPIFLTTGSKQLNEWLMLKDAAKRLYIRILPNADILAHALSSGLSASQIICMQGPFDLDMNMATIHHITNHWRKNYPAHALEPLTLVTKESGTIGGFDEKVKAASLTNSRLCIIGRPLQQSGISLENCKKQLQYWLNDALTEDTPKRQVSFIGMGMSGKQLTLEAHDALCKCDIIIGARRMIEETAHYHKPNLTSYDYHEITKFMLDHTEYHHFAIVFSGDIGFYSGASKIRACLKNLPFKINAYSGISSPIHLLNQLGIPWEDVHLISCHSQNIAFISHFRQFPQTLALLGKSEDAAMLCQKLCDYGYANCFVAIGHNMMQANEQILTGTASDFTALSLPGLSLLYARHEKTPVCSVGLPDSMFIRGKVPMTKSEIRSIILSKLSLQKDSILYDIGAGTGSVAIEAARMLTDGHVYAIEKNPEGIALIRTNSHALSADALTIIEGVAPDCLSSLPAPTHVFIGGSSGHLDEIIQLLLKKNPVLHLVISAITLETIAQMQHLIDLYPHAHSELIQIQVNHTKKAGSYHLFQGQNPVYILTLSFV